MDLVSQPQSVEAYVYDNVGKPLDRQVHAMGHLNLTLCPSHIQYAYALDVNAPNPIEVRCVHMCAGKKKRLLECK